MCRAGGPGGEDGARGGTGPPRWAGWAGRAGVLSARDRRCSEEGWSLRTTSVSSPSRFDASLISLHHFLAQFLALFVPPGRRELLKDIIA